MKIVLHKLTSMVMAFIVLLSTMSFTINMHYCGNTLVDAAIFKKAKTCRMEMQKASSTSDCSLAKKNCCNDEQLVFDGQDELKISFDKLTLEQQYFITSFVYSYINLFDGLEENANPFSEYPPPLIVRSIYKLDEVYLI